MQLIFSNHYYYYYFLVQVTFLDKS